MSRNNSRLLLLELKQLIKLFGINLGAYVSYENVKTKIYSKYDCTRPIIILTFSQNEPFVFLA